MLSPLRHELRNVLGPVSMVIDMLALRGGDNDIEVLARQSRLLALMLEDLLDLAAGVDARLALAARPVELRAAVDGVVAATAPYLYQLGVELAVDVPTNLVVVADPSCLAFALASVIRHAATSGGKLALHADRVRASVRIRLAPGAARLPEERALRFARGLLELQGGRLTVGDDLELSLRAPAIR